jgi:hypothetical protein
MTGTLLITLKQPDRLECLPCSGRVRLSISGFSHHKISISWIIYESLKNHLSHI